MPGQSGNPGGKPKGLARATRELVGEDDMKLAAFWLSIMEDPMRRDSDRLEASKLLADRGWGKAATYEPRRATRSTSRTWSKRRRSLTAKSLASPSFTDETLTREPCGCVGHCRSHPLERHVHTPLGVEGVPARRDGRGTWRLSRALSHSFSPNVRH
jgi:hypothetical protein